MPREEIWKLRPHPLFLRSLNPMLIADDERRYVDANPAACLFLRLSREAICELRIDDVTPSEMRPVLDDLWKEWLRGPPELGVQPFPWEYQMPDGPRVAVDFSCTRHFRPGRHLAIASFPPADTLNECVSHAAPPASNVLSKREREVLNLVALGNTGLRIAAELGLSPATVQRHMVNTLAKLGAKNRAHGIAIALQNGELDLDDVSTVEIPDSATDLTGSPSRSRRTGS